MALILWPFFLLSLLVATSTAADELPEEKMERVRQSIALQLPGGSAGEP